MLVPMMPSCNFANICLASRSLSDCAVTAVAFRSSAKVRTLFRIGLKASSSGSHQRVQEGSRKSSAMRSRIVSGKTYLHGALDGQHTAAPFRKLYRGTSLRDGMRQLWVNVRKIKELDYDTGEAGGKCHHRQATSAAFQPMLTELPRKATCPMSSAERICVPMKLQVQEE